MFNFKQLLTKYHFYIVPFFWSIISLFSGYHFIKLHYFDYLTNKYDKYGKLYSVSEGIQLISAIIAYLFAVIVIFYFYKFIVNVINNNGKERQILKYSIPIFLFFIYVLISRISSVGLTEYYRGDEAVIWDTAAKLYPFMFVYTSEITLITFFLCPQIYAPSLIKIIMCSLILGYTIYNCKKAYNTNLVYLFYIILFLFKNPLFETILSIHRMHWYSWFYIFFCVKAFFKSIDKDKNNTSSWLEIIFMCFLCAVLTCLRREGFYLILTGLILIIFLYGKINNQFNLKRSFLIGLTFLLFQSLVFAPIFSFNFFSEKGTSYNAFMVHMLGSGLDREKSQKELQIIDKKLDISIIDKYNEEMGVLSYADCYYSWSSYKDGKYFAIKNDNSISNDDYYNAIKNVILQQPLVFIKSRINAFKSVDKCFDKDKIGLNQASVILLLILLYAAIKRNFVLFVLSVGVLLHTIITFMTMPASYIKYFYQLILFSLFFITILLNKKYKNSDLKFVKKES